MLHDKACVTNYINGKLRSKQYTKRELDEKRKYFESCVSIAETRITKERWNNEIRRCFEENRFFDKYPDAGLSKLEFILEFGL